MREPAQSGGCVTRVPPRAVPIVGEPDTQRAKRENCYEAICWLAALTALCAVAVVAGVGLACVTAAGSWAACAAVGVLGLIQVYQIAPTDDRHWVVFAVTTMFIFFIAALTIIFVVVAVATSA